MTGFIEVNGHSINPVILRRSLINWGEKSIRTLPWRQTKDPYRILISEVMLHRTQSRQVVPVYGRFIEIFPEVTDFVRASKEDIHENLYSLGLQWRIDRIYDMARDLAIRFNSQVPKEKVDLLSLPGVGEYIAGAVRCFAWNLPEPILDTNTVRVTGRLFDLAVKDSSRRNHLFRELITALLDPKEPRAYNFALLDLADQICLKRQQPRCSQCPIFQSCKYVSAHSIF